MINEYKFAEELGLTIVDENATQKSKNDKLAFCLTRRKGIGGSEASIVLGVNKYTTLEELIQEKLSDTVTEEELRVGALPTVRKGADLEPLILNKFSEWAGIEVIKPESMFRINACPAMTVNFDGVYRHDRTKQIIPVEAKLVSQWGQKYWKPNKSCKLFDGVANHPLYAGKDIKDHILTISEMYGIPEYYYTQVQHQLIATGADYGWLVALFDRDWEIGAYKIYADGYVQEKLIEECSSIWESICEVKDGV